MKRTIRMVLFAAMLLYAGTALAASPMAGGGFGQTTTSGSMGSGAGYGPGAMAGLAPGLTDTPGTTGWGAAGMPGFANAGSASTQTSPSGFQDMADWMTSIMTGAY